MDPDQHGSGTFAWIRIRNSENSIRIRNKSFRIHNTGYFKVIAVGLFFYSFFLLIIRLLLTNLWHLDPKLLISRGWIRIKIILDSQQCIKGNLPVTDVFNVLWDGGIGPNTVAIHQRNQFAFLEKKEQSCTKHIQCC